MYSWQKYICTSITGKKKRRKIKHSKIFVMRPLTILSLYFVSHFVSHQANLTKSLKPILGHSATLPPERVVSTGRIGTLPDKTRFSRQRRKGHSMERRNGKVLPFVVTVLRASGGNCAVKSRCVISGAGVGELPVAVGADRKSTRLNSSHPSLSRMPSSA